MTIKKVQNFKTGEIWWIKLASKSSEVYGHEQAKTRPCIVIKDNHFTQMTTIIPLTKNKDLLKFPHTCLIKKNQQNNLNHDSVALIFQIRSLSYERYLEFIGRIDKNELKRIKILIRNYFE